MKWLRSGWIFLNMAVATLLLGPLLMLMAVADRSKRWVGIWPRIWARWILWSTGLEVSFRGAERLQRDQKYVYMSNHTSALDIPLAFAVLPGTVVFLAKKELFRIFFFGWCMRALGCIPVDRSKRRGGHQAMDRALRDLESKFLSIILYPEGTRTRDGSLLPFKRGGFQLALESQLPIVPIAVNGALEAVPPGAMSLTHTRIRLTIGDPIETEGLTETDRDDLLHRTYQRIEGLLQQT